jgi:hypothetical protein
LRRHAGAEHCHPSLAFDIILPLIGVGVPVELTHTTGMDCHNRDRYRSRNVKCRRVGDQDFSPLRLFRPTLFARSKREVARGWPERSGRPVLVQLERSGHGGLEDEELLGGNPCQRFWAYPKIFGDHFPRRVRHDVG